MPTNIPIMGRHRMAAARIPFRVAADREAFIVAANDGVLGKEPRFLGFTRTDWIYAGAPKHYLGYNHECPHPDLLILCGMGEAVDSWRREAASQYEGEHGPVPEFWNMPDLVAEWERLNPELAAAHWAYAVRESQAARRNGKAAADGGSAYRT